MDAWTELTQAAIRDRIQEREAEAAGERLATTARSAAVRLAAAVRSIAAPPSLPTSVSDEPRAGPRRRADRQAARAVR